MDESRAIPTATSFRTLSVDRLAAQRADLKAAGKKLSFTHLIAWAIVRAANSSKYFCLTSVLLEASQSTMSDSASFPSAFAASAARRRRRGTQ